MDLQLLKTALPFAFARKRKKWVLLLAALGFTGYSVRKVYQLPSVADKRKRISKLLAAFLSVAEAVSDSADSIGIVSKDLKEFLQSNSDQLPNSFKQISKITSSDEFSESLARVTQAVTLGVLQGYRSESCGGGDSSFTDRVMDKLFSTAGSGFASVVVGSFARNLVMGFFYSDGQASAGGSMDQVPQWVNVVCSDKCREMIGDCIQMFVSTAVAVYLDKTMDINFCDEMLSSLTHPKHEAKVKEMVVSVCNGAVKTLVVTSHQVLKSPNTNEDLWQEELLKRRNSFDEKNDSGNWVSKVSSTLAVPSNRRFVLDLTGKITFETVRSFLECLLEKLYEGVKRCLNVVHETVFESGLEVVRYAAAKSSVVATICLSLCMHILDGAWIFMPA